ncbi:MAG: VOC family protein, partial [Imperialibacter sp.]
MKIALTSIFVNDPIAAFKFYTEVLGFVEKMYMPEMQLAIVAGPDEPDGTSLLLEPNQNLGADTFQKAVYEAGLPTIVFGTKDINADYQRLREKGVVFNSETKKNDLGTQAVFEDNFGNFIQLNKAEL